MNGAVDPVSGAAVVLETAAALSALAKEGWKPERDVVFALFDGEEYGMLGSTRWVEQRLAAPAATGRRTFPQYHSAYDDPYLLGRILDPGYVMSTTLARILTLWTSVLAESSEPPWRLSEVATFLTDEFSRLGKAPAARLSRGDELFTAVVRLRLAARAWESLDAARRRASAERTEPLLLDAMGAFHDAAPAEFARRNLLLGPSAETGCGTETLPGLRRALRGDGAVEAETARLLRALATAEVKLREAVRIAAGN